MVVIFSMILFAIFLSLIQLQLYISCIYIFTSLDFNLFNTPMSAIHPQLPTGCRLPETKHIFLGGLVQDGHCEFEVHCW